MSFKFTGKIKCVHSESIKSFERKYRREHSQARVFLFYISEVRNSSVVSPEMYFIGFGKKFSPQRLKLF